MTIALTAPTGKIGTAVLAEASRRGLALRPLARRPTNGPRFDFTDPATHGPALAGVTTLLVVSPPSPQQAELEGVVYDAARDAGVKHVVKVSGEAADNAATRFAAQHRASELRLAKSGLGFTIVRPTFFMENLLPLPIAQGIYPAPMGEARMAQVAVADIAAVLLAIAASPVEHHGRTHTLTGPAASTGDEIARTLAGALGHEVRYVDVPEDTFRANLAGLDEWLAGGLVEAFRKVRAGQAATLTEDVARILGRAPIDLGTWARSQAFGPQSSSRSS